MIKFVASGHGHLLVRAHLRLAFVVQQLEALNFYSKLIQLKYNPVAYYRYAPHNDVSANDGPHL
jgi:hypothetical protein